MGLQRYRADQTDPPEPNGSVAWRANWVGGPSLALVRNCPTPFGARTVYASGEPDTFFSVPAACEVRTQGKRRTVRGYLGYTTGQGWTFHPYTGKEV